MSSLNKVVLIGNLGRDPEVRYTQTEKAVATLSLATDARWIADGKKQERTDWHQVVVWGATAEACGKKLRKGSKVAVEGRLQRREYEKDGEKKYAVEVVANTVLFLGGLKGAEDGVDGGAGDPPGDDGALPA